VFTTEFNRRNLEQRSAATVRTRRDSQHLLLLRDGHPPSKQPIAPRRGLAMILALTARRIDGETARRVIA
jgi:hypothetical protein